MSIDPNFSIVTLGVTDLQRSVDFYEALGWEQRGNQSDGICWFRTNGSWIGLFGYDELAADAGLVGASESAVPASPAEYRGITLAICLPSETDVDAAITHAASVGGRVVKSAERMEWGGYSGYFADPDGHLWEVAYNPNFPIDGQGRIDIP